MRLVAPVQVDDHRRQALERARARERPGVERASRDELARELERELLGARVVTADQRVLVGCLLVEVGRGDRMQARRDRARAPCPARARRGCAPRGRAARRLPCETRSRWRRRAAASRRAPRRPRDAVSSAASALTASTTRSAPRTASSFVAPLMRPPPSSSAASRARSASREPMTTSSSPSATEPARERAAEAAGAAEDGDPHAGVPAACTVAAARRRAALDIRHQRLRDDRAAQTGHRRARRVGLVDDEHVDQALVATPRRARASSRRQAG